MVNHVIEAKSGAYVLVMHAAWHQQIEVGRLGAMQVVPGYYLYVGSAFGPGGVRARVLHHMRVSERPRWHIDYLRQVCPLVMVWCSYEEVRREHEWVELLESITTVTIPMVGFGASDHPGKSHLFYSKAQPSFTAFSRRAGKQKGEHRNAPLYQILCQT